MKKIAKMTLDEFHEIDTDDLSAGQVMALSKIFADLQYEKRQKKIEYDPRDWSTDPDEAGWVCGVEGESVYYIPYLRIDMKRGVVIIRGWFNGGFDNLEVFKSEEKLGSFIDALVQVRNAALGA